MEHRHHFEWAIFEHLVGVDKPADIGIRFFAVIELELF